MPTLKRPASAIVESSKATRSAGPKAKAAKKLDPLDAKCSAICAMLEAAEGYPKEVLNMLSGAVHTSLGEPKEQRHEIQNSVIKMIGEVLDTVQAKHKDKTDALTAKIADNDSEKANRIAAAEAAQAVVAEKKEALEVAKGAAEAAAKEVFDASKALHVAEKEQKDGAASLEKAEKHKTTLEALVSVELKNLKEGLPMDAAKQMKALLKVCEENHFEPQLRVSAEAALSRAPETRGTFDNVVIQQLDVAFIAAIAKFTEQLNVGEAGRIECAGKVDSAKSTLDAARESDTARAKERDAAAVACKEAESAASASRKAVKEFGPEMKKAMADATEAEEALASCTAVAATFAELRDGSAGPELETIVETTLAEAATA